MSLYEVIVVTRAGSRVVHLDQATPKTITWELNEPTVAVFTIPAGDPKLTHLRLLQDEVQIWRDGELLFWGVPIRRSGNTTELLTYQCADPLWYFKRRYIGKADRTNLLTNPSFETDAAGSTSFTGWTVVDIDAQSVVDNNKIVGTRAAQLNNFDDQDGYIEQTLTASVTEPNEEYTLAAWLYIAENVAGAPAWSGPAYEERGLWLAMFRTSDDAFLEVVEDKVTDDTRNQWKNKWVRVECPPIVTPDDDVYFKGRLYSPGAWVVWDAALLVKNEYLAGTFKVDQATIAELIVEHLQDTAFGKSDVNIDTNCAATGVVIERRYAFHDHINGLDALRELTELDNGIDYDIVFDAAAGTRTFTSYHRKGTAKPELALEFGRNIEAFAYDEDGDQTANSIVLLGDGDGPDREEGAAVDNTTLGGLVLEDIDNAEPGAHVGLLDKIAARRLEQRKTTVEIPTITTYKGSDPTHAAAVGELLTELFTGDTVPVRASYGSITVNDDYRIRRKTLHCGDELLALETAPA